MVGLLIYHCATRATRVLDLPQAASQKVVRSSIEIMLRLWQRPSAAVVPQTTRPLFVQLRGSHFGLNRGITGLLMPSTDKVESPMTRGMS